MVSGQCFSQVVLCPPQNLFCSPDISVFLFWTKPHDSSGSIPAGLMGYKIYRYGDSIGFNTLPADTTYLDYLPMPGYIQYYVTAWYDLTPYGYPGQYGESAPSDTAFVLFGVDIPFPFFEDWYQGMFGINIWSFLPDQGNWSIDIHAGNPAPAAIFSGNPSETSYEHLLRSYWLPGEICLSCTDFLWIEFDYKLENINPTGTEKLEVELFHDSTWFPLWETTNQGSQDWTHMKFFINQARGNFFRVGFKVSGLNSPDINRWLVDNIWVTWTCRPPLNPSAINPHDNQVTVSWNKPVCDDTSGLQEELSGYYVYRTDSTGQPPFKQINLSIIQDTFFIDHVPAIVLPAQYRYYIYAEYSTCHGASDTVYLTLTGIENIKPSSFRIYPNPTNGIFSVDLPDDAVMLEISGMNGITILTRDLVSTKPKKIQLDLSNFPKGVYPLSLILKNGIIRDKVVIY